MSNTEQPSAAEGLIGPFSFLEFFGFTFFLLWGYFCFFTNPASLSGSDGGYEIGYVMKLCGFIGLVLSLLGCYLFSDRTGAFPNRPVLLAAGVLSFVFIIALLLLPFVFILYLLMNIALGAISGYILVCWVTYLSKDATPLSSTLVVLSVVLTALLGFLLTTVASSFSLIISIGSLLASLVLLWVLARKDPIEATITKEVSKKRRPMRWKTHVMFDLFGLTFGAAVFSLARFDAFFGIAIMVVLGALGAFVDIRQAGGVYPDRMKRLLIVLSVTGLLILPMTFEIGEALTWSLFAGLFAYFFTMQLNWTIYSGHRFKLNMASFLPEGQVHIWACMALGYAACWGFTHFGIDISLLTGIFIFLLVLGFALFTPTDLEGLTLLVFKEFSQDETSFLGPDEKRDAKRFLKRCSEVAKIYELTPRETEIMVFLAKGRNAEYISEKLVISKHTTKTHIYHIYQKLNINSQQVLMDLVEEYYFK